ncbi:MAG: threonine synthase [Candidatus Aminicenantes bacterium]|jgi:threonine synthase
MKEEFECLACDKKHPVDVFNTFCPDCKEPLLYHYPDKKRTISEERNHTLEVFLDFLPFDKIDHTFLLGEGNSPLVKLKQISDECRLPHLYVKDESFNPTGSFKDRGTAVAIQKVVSLKIDKIGTVSTGNMATSTAAYGARAGRKTCVFIKEDISEEKLLSCGVYGPIMIKVKGDYGELTYKSFELGRKHNIYFMNSVDPFRIEGYKVIGLEIFLQLGNQAPEYIFVPVSSGGHLIGLIKAYSELKVQGLIEKVPTFIGVQAEGCSPIARAFRSGAPRVERIKKANTVAQAITNPDPPGGNMLLNLIREHNGSVLAVSDTDILIAQKMLAEKEGIFCLPASATTLAGFYQLSRTNTFKDTDRIVLVVSGTGMKNLKVLKPSLMKFYHSSLSNLENILLTTID